MSTQCAVINDNVLKKILDKFFPGKNDEILIFGGENDENVKCVLEKSDEKWAEESKVQCERRSRNRETAFFAVID